jgi:hypothetical protein
VFTASHSSVEISSRTLRAFSRASDGTHDRSGVLLVQHEESLTRLGGGLVVSLGEDLVEVQDRKQVDPRPRASSGGDSKSPW